MKKVIRTALGLLIAVVIIAGIMALMGRAYVLEAEQRTAEIRQSQTWERFN